MKFTLRQARTHAGFNKSEMAEMLGVTEPTYKAYEEDPGKMHVRTLLKFMDLTGFTYEMLDIRLPL